MKAAEFIKSRGGTWPDRVTKPSVPKEPPPPEFWTKWRYEHWNWLGICEACPHLTDRNPSGGTCQIMASLPVYQHCGCKGRVSYFARGTGEKCPLGHHDHLDREQ